MTEPREVVAQQWGNETIDEYIDHHAYVGMSERQMADRAFRGGGASVIETTTAKILMRSMRNNLRATIDAQAQEIATLKAELAKAKREIELINEANAPMRPRAFWDDKMRANKGR